jgi:hypothetical protein
MAVQSISVSAALVWPLSNLGLIAVDALLVLATCFVMLHVHKVCELRFSSDSWSGVSFILLANRAASASLVRSCSAGAIRSTCEHTQRERVHGPHLFLISRVCSLGGNALLQLSYKNTTGFSHAQAWDPSLIMLIASLVTAVTAFLFMAVRGVA